MEEHKVIIVVVILGITAIVMMGLVAKIALLESQVANGPPGMRDSLRRRSVPEAKSRTKIAGGGKARVSPDNDVGENTSRSEITPPPKSLTQGAYGLPQRSSTPGSSSASSADGADKNEAQDRLAKATKSAVRVTVIDHKEEKNGVAVAVGEGILLVGAPLLAGGYEGWYLLPESRKKGSTFNRLIAHDPQSRLALVRVDAQDEPLTPLPVASVAPSKGARLTVFHESGQLEIGRIEATVEALLSAGDVEKKLQVAAPETGDAVWMELLGTFPKEIVSAPVLNPAGQLAGVVLLDSQGIKAASAPRPASGFGGGFGGAIGGGSAPAGATMRRVYAVSAEALTPLLEQAGKPADQLLFTLAVEPMQKRTTSGGSSRWMVKLASGETIDEKSFSVLPPGAGSGTLKYSSGMKCATLSLSERKTLDGSLIVYTADGKELIRESFVQGRRHGPFAASGPNGECVLAGQFQRDARHGYCAYFKNGAPWLIQEFADGILGPQHLVKHGAVFHTVASGKSLPTVAAVLTQYRDWPEWDSRLRAVESAIERWAKEVDRQQRGGRTRSNPDQLSAAEREAAATIEEFRQLVE